jgi:hypothetical protein
MKTVRMTKESRNQLKAQEIGPRNLMNSKTMSMIREVRILSHNWFSLKLETMNHLYSSKQVWLKTNYIRIKLLIKRKIIL